MERAIAEDPAAKRAERFDENRYSMASSGRCPRTDPVESPRSDDLARILYPASPWITPSEPPQASGSRAPDESGRCCRTRSSFPDLREPRRHPDSPSGTPPRTSPIDRAARRRCSCPRRILHPPIRTGIHRSTLELPRASASRVAPDLSRCFGEKLWHEAVT